MTNWRAGVHLGREVNGMTFEEIARVLGVSKQRVWMHYVSALRKLRRNPAARRLLLMAQSKEEREV